MIRKISVSRDGEVLGDWPFDVVFALYRAGVLLGSDYLWTEGFDDWMPVEKFVPASPSKQPAVFLGRDDEETPWVFYCRDGVSVIGPRPMDEIISSILHYALDDDDHLLITGEGKWITVKQFIERTESTGTMIGDLRNHLAEAASNWSEGVDPDEGWLEKGVGLAQVFPTVGKMFLAFHASKKATSWLMKQANDSK